MEKKERTYIAIDLKSFYASVECTEKGYDPLDINLVVADESRTNKTICLAVSPALKSFGIPGRPRLFEVQQQVKKINEERRRKAPGGILKGKSCYLHKLQNDPSLAVDFVAAMPRMGLYIEYSAKIYDIYLKYVAKEDICVYSIDEVFIDATDYLNTYRMNAHQFAMKMIEDIMINTGITATAGIGTNLYLAKVAMDIVAKKSPADRDGVRIAELNEESYRYLLWDHRPLTDFWQIGPGKAKRLMNAYMFTMGDVAARTQWDEEFFYKTFGIDGEILIDHAWGIEPVTMRDIKNYRSDSHSLSNGQVLPRPYKYAEARLVFCEMIDSLCSGMLRKNLTAPAFSWWVSYDYKSLEECPEYDGPLSIDFYGRLHPKHTGGTVKMKMPTSSPRLVAEGLTGSFDKKTDHRLLYRRLGVCALNTEEDLGIFQLDLFADYDALWKEKKAEQALLEIRRKYGPNAIFKGKNLLDGATTLERNMQIGGHRA